MKRALDNFNSSLLELPKSDSDVQLSSPCKTGLEYTSCLLAATTVPYVAIRDLDIDHHLDF